MKIRKFHSAKNIPLNWVPGRFKPYGANAKDITVMINCVRIAPRIELVILFNFDLNNRMMIGVNNAVTKNKISITKQYANIVKWSDQ